MQMQIPADAALSLRTDSANPNHHLYQNNNGFWWIHYTLHLPDYTSKRVRRSLKTRDEKDARLRRDSILERMGQKAMAS